LFGLPKSSFGRGKVVAKDSSILENHNEQIITENPNTSHVATIFCNHIANVLPIRNEDLGSSESAFPGEALFNVV
jgi:hypothetical protein